MLQAVLAKTESLKAAAVRCATGNNIYGSQPGDGRHDGAGAGVGLFRFSSSSSPSSSSSSSSSSTSSQEDPFPSHHGPEERAIDALFEEFDCEHVYLDVGTNIGVQIRKVYEPHKYRQADSEGNYATALQLFDKHFGPSPRCSVCSIGFEPNRNHAERLDTLQARLRRAGAGVLVLRAAASVSPGSIQFGVGAEGSKNDHNDWGASIFGDWDARLGRKEYTKAQPRDAGNRTIRGRGDNFIRVRSVDLAHLITYVDGKLQDKFAGSRGPSRMVMKLDVEGAEMGVAPHLLAKEVLCKIDAVFIEWHPEIFKQALAKATAERADNVAQLESQHMVVSALQQAFRLIPKASPGDTCRTEYVDMDDESYLHDGMSWPDDEPAGNASSSTSTSTPGSTSSSSSSKTTTTTTSLCFRPPPVRPPLQPTCFGIVKNGDTLAGFAERYDVPLADLRRWNPDLEPTTMFSGQLIAVKAACAAPVIPGPCMLGTATPPQTIDAWVTMAYELSLPSYISGLIYLNPGRSKTKTKNTNKNKKPGDPTQGGGDTNGEKEGGASGSGSSNGGSSNGGGQDGGGEGLDGPVSDAQTFFPMTVSPISISETCDRKELHKEILDWYPIIAQCPADELVRKEAVEESRRIAYGLSKAHHEERIERRRGRRREKKISATSTGGQRQQQQQQQQQQQEQRAEAQALSLTYIVMAHKATQPWRELLCSLLHPNDTIVIHLDRRASTELRSEMEAVAAAANAAAAVYAASSSSSSSSSSSLSNGGDRISSGDGGGGGGKVFVMPLKDSFASATFSPDLMVAELAAMEFLVSKRDGGEIPPFDYNVLLDAAAVPLRPRADLAHFLWAMRQTAQVTNFLTLYKPRRREHRHRVWAWNAERSSDQNPPSWGWRAPDPSLFTSSYCSNNQWRVLGSAAVDYIAGPKSHQVARKFVYHFSQTYTPDEVRLAAAAVVVVVVV